MIFFDGVHLVTDNTDLAELHSFAERMGIKKCWFEGVRKNHPHYDVPKRKIELVKTQPDVKIVSSREIVEVGKVRKLSISDHKILTSDKAYLNWVETR